MAVGTVRCSARLVAEDSDHNGMIEQFRKPLPVSFRIIQNGQNAGKFQDIAREWDELLDGWSLYKDGPCRRPQQIDWLPGAWRLGAGAVLLRERRGGWEVEQVANWLSRAVATGYASRQEEASMIPVALIEACVNMLAARLA